MSTTSVLGGVVKRREDPALIQGKGLYVDDVKLPGMLHAAFLRSPFAHARINSIDASAALAMDGVRAVYTIDDVRHLGPLLAQLPVGKQRPLLADGMVNHAGEAVAMVVADSRYVAQDAVETIDVDYEPLAAIVDLKEAASDAVLVHDDLESNTIIAWAGHEWWAGVISGKDGSAEIEAAKQRDDVVIASQEMVNQRLIPTAIEPRSVVADWNTGYDRITIYSSSQIIHAVAAAVAKTFGLPTNSVHGIAPEVGGGFGCKLNVYVDEILTCFASKDLGRPVKFTETRREAAVSTIQGRGWIGTATIVGTKDGEILGYEFDGIADMGAYSQNITIAIPLLGVYVAQGQYDIPLSFNIKGVHTHTMTTDAYRGAGRPEAAYYIERIVDVYARKIGMDPAEVRRKNYFKKEQFPATTAIGLTMDTGDYEKNLDAMLDGVGWSELLAERDQARAAGRHIGVGISSYVEVCGFGPSILAEFGFSFDGYGAPSAFTGTGLVRVNTDGSATVIIGTGPSGQGHETTWAQIVGDGLGIPIEQIQVLHGDTKESPFGVGTFGSRSIAVDGAAAFGATAEVRGKAAAIAAHLLEASADDIRFEDGSAHVAGSPDKAVSWADIAKAAHRPHMLPEGMAGGLEAVNYFDPPNATWPFGTHLAMVEVDPETGNFDILRYVTVDDCGNVVNPMIVDGQVHGGITQGVAQAVLEEAIYDEDGNLLTPSLMDYPIPTASDVPSFELHRTVTPTDVNPLGVKGIGEAGTIGSAQTIVNAVVDALAPLGVEHIEMPLRPRRVWQAIQDAKGA